MDIHIFLRYFEKIFPIIFSGYPSSTYIELTIGSGNSYTAPANGWFWAHKSANGTGQDFAADVYDIEGVLKYQLSSHPNVSGYIANVLAPVLQGDVMLLTYSTLGTTYSTLRFIYAADNS